MAKNYLSYKLRALPFYDAVTKAGGKIYAVGGPVRDFILGKQSKDLDIIVTGIDYDLLQGILENYGKTDLVGKSFGIIKFRETPTSEEIDVALPRTEKKTGQGYQGFEVSVDPNMSVEDEMKRRDITINSLAMDGDGNIVDPFNGLNDIKNRVIKATSNDSFSEDPLRMLRVVQFATRFGFNLDSQTESMIRQNASLIKEISPERYIIEFDKIVSKGKPIQGIKLLISLNLFQPIFGFQYKGKFNNFNKVKTIGEFLYLCVLTSENFEILKKRFGSALPDKIKKEIEALTNLNLFGQNKIENLFTLMKMYKFSPETIQNSMLVPNELKQMAQKYPMDNKQLDITGMDIMALGFKGKDVGDKIIEIFKAIFSDQIPNQKQAIIDYLKKDNLNEKQELKGGKADKLTLAKIAKQHKISLKLLTKEFQKGMKVEAEHTDNKEKMKEIAMDHLAEDPKYYTKLKKAKLEEIITKELKEESLPSKLKSDIEIEYHKKLNDEFWLNNHLKSNIRKNLINLVNYYFKSLELDPKVEIKDIIFTGSLANYNYTDLSDIDLHIVIDYKDVSDDVDFVMDYFLQKRAAWEVSNDVKINGYPVEIFVQDVNEQTVGKGAMYSLMSNKWVKKPKYKLPDVDRHLVTQKVNMYLDILNKISMTKDSIKKVDNYNKVFNKIKKKRGEATKTEGEFSVDNLVFKVLRNKKVFDIVKNNKKEIVNNVFSINSD